MREANTFLKNYWGGCKMIKGLELFQLIQFYYTVVFTLYAIPKYIYLLKTKTVYIFPILLICSSVTAPIIIGTYFYDFYIINLFYEEITEGLIGWLVASSICFVVYSFCYWIMSTLYINVRGEILTIHSVFFAKTKINISDVLLSESYYCFIPREFNMNEILLITLKNGKKYKLGFDAFTHSGDTEEICEWAKKFKYLTDEKKFKELMKSNKYKSLTFKLF